MDNDIYKFLGKDLYRLSGELANTPTSTSVVNPASIDSGTSTGFTELGYGGIKQGKTAFNNTETGFILGIDNGLAKFYIGNTTDYLNWDGTTLTIAGTFQLGGSLITVSDIDDLQDALDDVGTLGGGTVAMVPNTYNATTSFTIPSGATLDLSGATIDFGNGAYQILIEGTNAYSTGTLAVNYASGSVTGTGTTWTAAMVGRSILIGDYWYTITARASDTAITISPVFMAPNVTGVTYVIATTVIDVGLLNGTLQNASGTLFKFRYCDTLNVDGMLFTDGTQGIDGDDSSYYTIKNSDVDDCVAGVTYNNVRFYTSDIFGATNITGGTAVAFNGVSNAGAGLTSVQAVTGVGVSFTSCFNFGFDNFSIIECSSHGIECVSGNSAIDINSGYFDTTGGDCVKLTATSDGISLDLLTTKNHTGYAVNIAAASDDNTNIGFIDDDGSGTGKINNSGTGTVIMGDDTAYASSWNGNLGTPTKNAVYDQMELKASLASPTFTGTVTIPTPFTLGAVSVTATGTELNFVDGVTSAIQTQLDAKVNDTGDETIAGVKTFSSDPLIPDEVYGSGWNGVLEPPTKNAVYDKIETLTPSCVTYIPQPSGVSLNDPSSDVFAMVTNTLAHVGQVVLPFSITVNKLTIRTGAVTTPGDFDVVIYTEDGQTQKISETFAVSTANTLYTETVSSVVLSAGIYYVFVVPNGVMNAELLAWNLEVAAPFSQTAGMHEDVASEPVTKGTLTVTAGTPPATFDPTAIVSSTTNDIIIVRLDN